VFIKRIELTNFKSFGGTTAVPYLPGFTVISGPNGSGKSNLIDALLFCLGLAGSKGMRAERLPDLVNTTQASRNRSTIEAAVTVTFDLTETPEDFDEVIEQQVDQQLNGGKVIELDSVRGIEAEGSEEATQTPVQADEVIAPPKASSRFQGMAEWSVTRRLRVTQQGTYTSNYFMNSEPCTLTELHEELARLHVYPEGYNVVLQGDVTRIISMNSRERREIIDDLAGVGAFDRKINQARGKLDEVKDREERYHIVEKELIDQRDRLAQDKVKAEKYKKLRTELHTKEQWEVVLRYRQVETAILNLRQQILADQQQLEQLTVQAGQVGEQIKATSTELDQLNAQVKALGEDELLALQATIASREAELRQLQRQETALTAAAKQVETDIAKAQQELQENQQNIAQLAGQHSQETGRIAAATEQRDAAKGSLQASRDQASASADHAEAWAVQQTELHHRIETLVKQLEPQRTEQARLRERTERLSLQGQDQGQTLTALEQSLAQHRQEHSTKANEFQAGVERVQTLAAQLSTAEGELKLQQETQNRLLHEQREKQRQLDKLEAQTQAIKEAQGTHATQIILQMKLDGVHGMVAQLGNVAQRYQLALETAAGARMGNLVVADDGVAAAAIEVLKRERAGRATFLPMNKIRAPHIPSSKELSGLKGCVDYAYNLIDFDDLYDEVFAYVFGTTVVFDTLAAARRYLGQYRMVTLDGELMDVSGAMTGGSVSQRQALHFGSTSVRESSEIVALRDRLKEIDQVLHHCITSLERLTETVKTHSQELIEARQQTQKFQLETEQLAKEVKRLETELAQQSGQSQSSGAELATALPRLAELDQQIPLQEAELTEARESLAQLENSHSHSEWQQVQATIRAQEEDLSQKEQALRTIEQRVQDLANQQQRLGEKVIQATGRIEDLRQQQTQQNQERQALTAQQSELNGQVEQAKVALAELEQRLGIDKQARDRLERQLRDQQGQLQSVQWQQEKIREAQTTRNTELATLGEQLQTQAADLPDPIPELPPEALEKELPALQYELRAIAKRLQAMEPVNMLALEEYERTNERLQELTDKLRTLQEERTELLLRIENFTTLRQRAFKEAFDAVNINFASIFAVLSDGDGYLQLEDANDPFNGGLNMVAHPKGKAVQRLASMSGGEKSLTALSFIFALQRYRPSPFYAFDEVDMFLDGANVERLSKMVKQQAELAQFIVVSLRRPMIEAAQRTIGVTQARGAYTQVLGIDLTQAAAGQ
jgi:chromosome segregation protein